MQVSAIRPGLAARNQWQANASLPRRMASASLITPTDPRTTPRWPCRDTGISSNPDREDGASILCVDQLRGSLAAAILSQTRKSHNCDTAGECGRGASLGIECASALCING